MYAAQCVLGLIVLYVECTQSWDIAVTHGDLLELYTDNTKTHTVRFNSHKLAALAYDEVHNMLLYVDKESDNDTICGYGISSKLNKCFIERNGRNIHSLTFDPVTELVFFSDTNERSINWISLKPGSNKYGNLLIKMDNGIPTDVAVDSCKGYVYWININLTTPTVKRTRLNGSETEVIMNVNSLAINTTYKLEPHSLTIDQRTQIIYWIEPESTSFSNIFYAHINENVLTRTYLCRLVTTYKTMFFNPPPNTLTVSNTNLFHVLFGTFVWELKKNKFRGVKRIYVHAEEFISGIAANYKIKEQITQDLNDCEALTTLEQKISQEPGYIGERCDVLECENYCLQGNCSVNDEGLPSCRCNAGHSGKRCEVDMCLGYCLNNGACSLNEKSDPICQCKGDHTGDRCEVSGCLSYCIQGNCSFNVEGLPECRCNFGYSGERCEVAACHSYCLNNGICSLNEEDEPFCECVGGYKGSRCEAVQTVTLTFPNAPAYSADTNGTLADLLSNRRKLKILVIVDES